MVCHKRPYLLWECALHVFLNINIGENNLMKNSSQDNNYKTNNNQENNDKDRLIKQIKFIEEIDKEKLIGRTRHILQMLQGKKMMLNTRGIWQLWRCC